MIIAEVKKLASRMSRKGRQRCLEEVRVEAVDWKFIVTDVVYWMLGSGSTIKALVRLLIEEPMVR